MGASVSRQQLRKSRELRKPLRLVLKKRAQATKQQVEHEECSNAVNWRQCLSFKSQKVHAVEEDDACAAVAAAQHVYPCWWRQDQATESSAEPALQQQDAVCQVDPTELATCSCTTQANPAPITWRKGERIGCGAYGSVYMGLNTVTGELLAIKEIVQCVRDSPHQHEALQQLEQEPFASWYATAIWAPNGVPFSLQGGSIASVISRFGQLDEPVIRTYTRQLLAGLAYLHAERIVHRDIKGANLLVEKDGLVKVADMGMAKEMEAISVTRSFKGSPFWMAPEVVRQQGHGWPADIWSVGCTVLEMATGRPPWSECTTQVQAIFKIASSDEVPAIPETLSASAADFLGLCLQRDPHQRPSAQQLLRHPWVAGVDVHVPPAPPLPLTAHQLAMLGSGTAVAGMDMMAGNDDDAIKADARRTRGSRAAVGRVIQQHPWVTGNPRNSSPKRRNAAAAAALIASAASTAGRRTFSGPVKAATTGAAAVNAAKQQAAGHALRQQLGQISTPGVSTGSPGCTASAVSLPPGGFRQLRARTVTAEDAIGCPTVPEEAVNFGAEQLLQMQPSGIPGLGGPCSSPS